MHGSLEKEKEYFIWKDTNQCMFLKEKNHNYNHMYTRNKMLSWKLNLSLEN